MKKIDVYYIEVLYLQIRKSVSVPEKKIISITIMNSIEYNKRNVE